MIKISYEAFCDRCGVMILKQQFEQANPIEVIPNPCIRRVFGIHLCSVCEPVVVTAIHKSLKMSEV